MGRVVRRHEIDRRRRRRNKIRKLRGKIAASSDTAKIGKWVEKIKRIHPFYPIQKLHP